MKNKSLIFSLFILFIITVLLPVSTAETGVCQIVDGYTFTTLQEALDEIETGETIKLLDHIEHQDTIEVSGKNINFDLNGYTLNVTVTTGDAIVVGSGGIITLDDWAGGELNASGGIRGVYAHDGGEVTVTNAVRLVNADYYGEENCAAYAVNYGKITVKNDATGYSSSSYGAYAYNRGIITVGGNCTGVYVGAQANVYGSVKVEKNSTGAYRGSWAINHGTIEVQGDSIATGSGNSAGAQAKGDSTITIYGNARGLTDGLTAEESNITVHGDCSATETYTGTGVTAAMFSNVTVKGNVYGRNYGIRADNASHIRVEGNVQSNSCAIWYTSNSEAVILGNVISGNQGIILYSGNIWVEGTVSASSSAYIEVFNVKKNASDGVIDGNYYRFSNNNAYVYVKIPPVINEISCAQSFIVSTGGDLQISVSGINMPENLVVAAFNGETKDMESTATGDSSLKTATLSFAPAEGESDINYIIKASMDGGSTWAVVTDSVILRHAPVPVTDIAISSEGDITTLYTGNPLQLTAAVTPSDADYTDVTWSVIPGTGDATITSSGLMTGTSGGTVTVKATANDDSGVFDTFAVTFSTKPVMSGTITINGQAKFDEVLTADISSIIYTPDTSDDIYTIQWKRNGANISGATGSTYKLVQADIGCVITVTVSADGINASGSVSASTSVVEKQDGPPAPPPPTLDWKDHNSVHLVDLPSILYIKDGDSYWQAFPDFIMLYSNTTYTFRIKIAATATRKESPVSEPLYVTTDPPPDHLVTYYANDGEETPTIINSVQEGTTFQLIAADSFTPPLDKRFKQWNEQADGSGNGYAAGATRTMQAADMEFYAIWERTTYPVTYYSNSGTGTAPTETDKLSGQTFQVAVNSFIAPVEKKFMEWNTKADGSGESILPGATVTVGYEKVDLYAIWEVITYPVTYHANGGSGEAPLESDRAKDNVFLTAAADSFIAPVEKKFKQWNTKANGTGVGYGAEVNISMPSGGIDLYAIWEDITYPATYHKNDGTGDTVTGSAKAFGQSFSALSSGTFAAPSERRFVEWNTQADGNGVGYAAGASITMPSGGINLYAVWEVITYSVTYYNYPSYDNYGISDISMGTAFEAAECTFDPPFEKKFKEWTTNPYGGGEAYKAGKSIIMPSGGLDLYAAWEWLTHKVIYDGNGSTGGSVPVDSNEYTYSSYATILSSGTLSKTGYRFVGWNTEADGTGTTYGYSCYIETEDITLYAQWERYIGDDFIDPNFKQAVWEWLGNAVGSTPGGFTKQDLNDNMSYFKTLSVSNKGITSLAGIEHFFSLGLEYLYCEDNQLISLPELPNTLILINCYNNELTSLPALPDSLEILYCYNNELTSLPELPGSLQRLRCNTNKLTSLPELPASLEYLECQENDLTVLPQLPSNLIRLYCGHNKLESLPELPDSIELINCWGNDLESLPALPDSLDYLQCSYNRIKSLPSISESLQTLDCRYNLLTDLPELPSGLNIDVSENFMDVSKDPIKSIIDNYDGTKHVTPQFSYLSRTYETEIETGSNYSFAGQMYRKSMYAEGYMENAIDDISEFSFISSDEGIATVDESGIITAVGDGNCTITALFKDFDFDLTKVELEVISYTLYTITYNANGGAGDPPAEVQVRAGGSLIPAANSMTPPGGMRLKEWNTAADGSGDSYIPSDIYIMPGRNLSLYAIWEVIPTYTVTYDGNGNTAGSVPTDSNIYYEGDYAEIADSAELTKPGYKFGGWNTKSDGSGRLYLVGRNLRIGNDNVILYAHWNRVITNDFTDVNFRQVVWEWLGNPVGSTPGDFTELDLNLRAEDAEHLNVSDREIESLAGLEHFKNAALYSFICDNNRLSELRDLPDYLLGLSCMGNQIESLPDLPVYMQVLRCSNNLITCLPVLPENMMALICDNNYLGELPQIPESMRQLSFAGNYIKDVSRPDIDRIMEDEGLVIGYPQIKLGGSKEELKLREGEKISLANEFITQVYDGTVWSEIIPLNDISSLYFSSSNNNIVKVSEQGVITGTGGGKCQIIVLLGNNDLPYTKVVFNVDVTPKPATASNTGKIYIISDQVAEAIEKAEDESEDNGLVTANINVSAPAGVNSINLTLPKKAAEKLSESNIDLFTITTQFASFSFSHAAIKGISDQSDGDIIIGASIADPKTLSDEVIILTDNRPVYSFKVLSGNKPISQFNDKITVSVPYTIRDGEDQEAIVIYYINAHGQPEMIKDCIYNAETGRVTFTTDHFSNFAVGYNKISYDDVDKDAWYNKAVIFAAARGITEGIGNNCFGPEVELTRGQFIVMLMKAYGIDPDISPTDNFVDAGNTFYTGYLAVAKRLGISVGIGNNMYGPENEITRQEMVTLLYNTLKQLGKLPTVPIDALPEEFIDADKISIWAREAMTLFVRAGIISGSGGSLNPDDVANRAQMVQVLYKLRMK